MANITGTFGKLLNTVAAIADSTTKLVDVSTSGVDMLDTFVRTAKEKQEARTMVDMHTFYEDLHNESALENAIKADALNKELSSNPTIKIEFDKQFKNLETVINNTKSKYNPV